MSTVKKCKESLGSNLYLTLRKKNKIPIKHIMFVAEYITNRFNGTDAYLKTIAKKTTTYNAAAVEACKLLKNPKICGAIKIVLDEWLAEKKLKLEKQIIDRLYAKAFYDPSIFFNPDGSVKFKKWEDIPEEYRCCVEGMEVKYYGRDADRSVVILKLADQSKAMNELSKYIELYKEASTTEHTLSDDTVNNLKKIFSNIEIKE